MKTPEICFENIFIIFWHEIYLLNTLNSFLFTYISNAIVNWRFPSVNWRINLCVTAETTEEIILEKHLNSRLIFVFFPSTEEKLSWDNALNLSLEIAHCWSWISIKRFFFSFDNVQASYETVLLRCLSISYDSIVSFVIFMKRYKLWYSLNVLWQEYNVRRRVSWIDHK